MRNTLQGMAVLRVLRHPAMLRLWLAQVIYLSVQFAASYAMIIFITIKTNSATMVGLVIITLSLPIVLFGAPAGALVDHLDRRAVLWISNVVRAIATALFIIALLVAPDQYYSIYVLAFFFSLVGLFFTPAEGAIIPGLVDESELLPALSLYNLTLNASQAIGLLILGPVALNFLPAIPLRFGHAQIMFTPIMTLFAIITILYLFAALLTSKLPIEQRSHTTTADEQSALARDRDTPHVAIIPDQPSATSSERWGRIGVDLREGWQLVRHDGMLAGALFQACFGGLVMLTIAQLAPIFVQRLLSLPANDTALIFAPAGVGLVAGGVLVPSLVGRLGSTRTMVAGMIGTAIGIGMLPLTLLLKHANIEILFLVVVIALTVLVGFSLDLIVVPAQTRIQEHSPDAMRARIQAFYQVVFNGGSIPVMLSMGTLTDRFGLVPVLFVLAGCAVVALLLTISRDSPRRPETPPPPADVPVAGNGSSRTRTVSPTADMAGR